VPSFNQKFKCLSSSIQFKTITSVFNMDIQNLSLLPRSVRFIWFGKAGIIVTQAFVSIKGNPLNAQVAPDILSWLE
jgi:hypothetical protein